MLCLEFLELELEVIERCIFTWDVFSLWKRNWSSNSVTKVSISQLDLIIHATLNTSTLRWIYRVYKIGGQILNSILYKNAQSIQFQIHYSYVNDSSFKGMPEGSQEDVI